MNRLKLPDIDAGYSNGLTDSEVASIRASYGSNSFKTGRGSSLSLIIKDILTEPLFLMLAVACTLYYLLQQYSEGNIMLLAILLVSGIAVYNQQKSSKALKTLADLTEPLITVRRNGREQTVSRQDLVPGDILVLAEGIKVPADCTILQSNDLSVNESTITGESLPVNKDSDPGNNILFQGTTLFSGYAIARVTATGINTQLGRIARQIEAAVTPRSPLQKQITRFIRSMAVFGVVAFVLVLLLNLQVAGWKASLLFALTIAMSVLPEEIPVAFSSFMALSAFAMSKAGIISRRPQVIEELGAVNCICLDKTGTITQNQMELKTVYNYSRATWYPLPGSGLEVTEVTWYAMLASEQQPFDAMEKAIFASQEATAENSRPEMVAEFPLEGQPPMMTHVYSSGQGLVAAAKGAPERILQACKLLRTEQEKILAEAGIYASKGYRVLGVASCQPSAIPARQDEFPWVFLGLIGLYDPPKDNVRATLRELQDAGIAIKMLTGDYAATAINIAKQVGMGNEPRCITGEALMKLEPAALQDAVHSNTVFARMFPDAKKKVVETLKAGGSVVAMTGDGVNDGPALRIANIGIAMGQKGTALAREASNLVITDDNISLISVAVATGRKVYTNFKKAVGYIISIHIPIIITAALLLLLGWKYANIFTPVHVIFMELIMGPTCSLFFEKEPPEKDIMLQPPRRLTTSLFSNRELAFSILRGIAVTVAVLVIFYYFMQSGSSIQETRTAVFTTLIAANAFLTLATRSRLLTMLQSIKMKNSFLLPVMLANTGLLAAILLSPAVQQVFKLSPPGPKALAACFAAALLAVAWTDLYKINNGLLRASKKSPQP